MNTTTYIYTDRFSSTVILVTVYPSDDDNDETMLLEAGNLLADIVKDDTIFSLVDIEKQ